MQHRPTSPGRSARREGYLELSRKPLHILMFILPLLAAYEYGSARYLSDPGGSTSTIRAWSILLGFFQDFGVAGRYLPAAAIVSVLVVWHILSNDRARVRLWVLPAMLLESAAWLIPLLVLLVLIGGDASHAKAAAGVSGAAGIPQELLSRPWQARATVSIGAGIYEELLFRMIGIAALHLILVDLAKLSDRVGTAIAVVLTAAAFAAYHDPVRADGSIEWLPAIQLGLAGGYFGLIYLSRGFGVVVALHALYDIVVLVVFPQSHGTP